MKVDQELRVIHNCHVHVFTIHHVPDTVHPAIKFLRNRFVVRLARVLLKSLHRLADIYLSFGSPAHIGLFLRLLSFLDLSASIYKGKSITQEEVFRRLRGAYPQNTKFVCLPLDMDFIGETYHPAPKDYRAQLDELRQLRDKYPNQIIPFVCADPRRDGFFDLVKEYIDKHEFAGIKLYPAMGFFPFDSRLNEMYRWAEEGGIPVLTHCTPGGLYRRTLPKDRSHPLTHKRLPENNPAAFAVNYTHPRNYDEVLMHFKNLKLCLAHFGGNVEWNKFMRESSFPRLDNPSWVAIILKQIRDHEHVYADISYTAYERDLLPMLRVLIGTPKVGDRILFGTDYFVVQADAAEREYGIRLRGTLGEEEYWRIAQENPVRFLQRL